MKQIITTTRAPGAIGPYSQAVKATGFAFLSGQIAIDPKDNRPVSSDVGAQTERILQNVKSILEAAGSTLDKLVKTSVFLKSMSDFAAMNEIYAKHFQSNCPARSTVEVARLPRDMLVEIEVIALA